MPTILSLRSSRENLPYRRDSTITIGNCRLEPGDLPTGSETEVRAPVKHVHVDGSVYVEHFPQRLHDRVAAHPLEGFSPVRQPPWIVFGVHQRSLRANLSRWSGTKLAKRLGSRVEQGISKESTDIGLATK